MTEPLLGVEGLRTMFPTDAGPLRAVDGLSFDVNPGETFAVVGESGSGKSVTALSIMRLLQPPGRVEGGQVRLRGRDLLRAPERVIRRIRGAEIGMIFQEPMSSLNPLLTIGEQIAETTMLHRGLRRSAALRHAEQMLARVGMPEPGRRLSEFPHRLSGGMRQRTMIAMALACSPPLLIADEPTTALDVTIQAQILELLRGLQADFGMAVLFITHDLGVVAQIADRVLVMYAGRAVEQAPVGALFARPLHPYTRALLGAIPRPCAARAPDRLLAAIPGQVPSPAALPSGCAFAPRCTLAVDACTLTVPGEERPAPGRSVRCFRWAEA